MKNYIDIAGLIWNQELPKKLFLEASAGTGKTYAIQHYVVRAILEEMQRKKSLLHPKNLLVVTFTKAAAHELKVRIEETIHSAYQTLLSSLTKVESEYVTSEDLVIYYSQLGFSYLLGYLFYSSDEKISLHECKKRASELIYALRRFLQESDLCEISTIHSFLHNALVQFSLMKTENCNLDTLDIELIENIVKSDWVNEQKLAIWVYDSLSWALPEGTIYPYEWKILISKYRESSHLIEEIAKALVQEKISSSGREKIHFSDPSFPLLQRHRLWEKIVLQYNSWHSDLNEEVVEYELLISWISGKKGSTKRDGAVKKELFEALQLLVSQLQRGMLEENSVLVSFSYEQLSQAFEVLNPIVQEENKKRVEDKGREIAEKFFHLIWPSLIELVSCDAIYNRIYGYLASRFISLLKQGKGKTFQSILEISYDLVCRKDGAFSRSIQDQFQVVILDEFQDTDLLQWSIFKKLFFDFSTLCKRRILFVGDPKQAIYFFRNADVYTYIEAKKSFYPHEIGSLNKNYRASPEMVSALNRLFSSADSYLFFMPKIEKSLNYEKLIGCATHLIPYKKSRNGTSIHFALGVENKGAKRVWPSLPVEDELLFPWIYREICDLLHSENLVLSDIAILVKDRYQAARLEFFLQKRDLSSKIIRSDDITESPLFPFMAALIKAIEYAPNLGLLSELFLVSKTALGMNFATSISSDIMLQGEITEVFIQFKKSFYSSGVGALVHLFETLPCIYEKTCIDLIYEFFGSEIQNQIDYEHIVEIISKLVGLGYRSLIHIRDAMYHLSEIFSEEREFLVRRTDETGEMLHIMTIHRSKGLEFSVVFALGACSRTQDERDTFDLLRKEEQEAEKSRLLYVAMTRAKYRLYLPYIVESSLKPIPFGTQSPLELFFASHRGKIREEEPFLHRSDWIENMQLPLSYEEVISILLELQKEAHISFSSIREELSEEREQKSSSLEEKEIEKKVVSTSPLYEKKESFSFSKLTRGKDALNYSQMNSSKKGRGKLFGIRFHTAISQWFEEDIRQYCDIFCDASFFYTWVKNRFPFWKEEVSSEISKMLCVALQMQLPLIHDERISLIELQQQQRARFTVEKKFLQKKREGVTLLYSLEGTIDLIFFHNNRMYMIDWKTNTVKDGTMEQVIIDAEYGLQATLYSRVALQYIQENPCYEWGGFFLFFLDPLLRESLSQVGVYFNNLEHVETIVGFPITLKKEGENLTLQKSEISQLFQNGSYGEK